MPKTQFPKDFLWGASTSAYQVEGGNHNQWSAWEEAHADALAASAEHRYSWLPNWEDIKTQATNPDNYINGQSVDHFNRYKEDFDLVKKLNMNAFRFGIEWSRIEPEEGQWNEEAIAHYRDYIKELKARDIQPVITLWHWTMPVWFARKGGFAKRRNLKYFERYVERVAGELIIPSGMVITINEANSYIGMSYLEGQWPPGKHRPLLAVRVYHNLAVAHRRVYKLLKRIDADLIIGVAHQCNNSQPKRSGNYLDRLVAWWANYGWNWWWLNRIRRCQDFVGFNYYFTDYFRGIARSNPMRHNKAHHTGQRGLHRQRRHNPLGPLSDLGWYMEPSGIQKVIEQAAKRYKQPIIITETGVADAKDQYRQWWLEETMAAVERAKSKGANVVGYFEWSLLDNFEWGQGWWPKFGQAKVDRSDGMKRQLRPSSTQLAEQIRELSV